MLKAIFGKTCLAAALLSALGASSAALAANPSAQHHKHTVVDRKAEKVKTDTGFTHTMSKTDDRGATATRRTDVVVNKAEGSRTRSTSGTTFDGTTYTSESTAHKTENGYVSQGQLTTSDGKVVNRSVNATVDKEAGTVTKEISVTPQGGETKTKTLVRPLKGHK